MAALHDALQCLLPTSWDEVPQSPDALREYVRDIFKSSRLVAESLPDPPPYDIKEYQELGSQALNSKPRTRIVPSPARVGETDLEITSIQKQWGKPIKMGGPKDNPLGIHVWKLSSNDGKGSWFGRRSIHDGLPFSQWRKKLSSEYEETLKVNQRKIEKGETPDNCIRGIGAEAKIESIEVKDEDGSVLGQVAVYHVSAQFPKPTAPRDFVAMIITSDVGLQVGGTKQPGRSWMMISKPCDHPHVPHRNGFTRGEYESVELIREIPRSSSNGATNGNTVEKSNEAGINATSSSKANNNSEDALVEEGHHAADGEDEETNPVEWIMVTRSDPGGSIPRWMVDKGTPKSVGVDAAKFVNWAAEDDKPRKRENPSETSPIGTSRSPENQPRDSTDDLNSDGDSLSGSDTDSVETDTQSHHGLIASVTGLLSSGLERFAPQALFDYVPHQRTASGQLVDNIRDPEDELDENSAPQPQPTASSETKPRDPHLDQISLSSAPSGLGTPGLDDIPQNNLPPAELMQIAKAGKLTSHEKDLAKLALRKREIDAKLETIRSELDKLHIPAQSNPSTPSKGIYNDVDSDTSGIPKRTPENASSTPTTSSQKTNGNGDSSSSDTPSPERKQKAEPPAHVHKAASQLLHEESKLLKQLRKVEASQLKAASKIEARQRKQVERSEKSKSKSENETLRQEVKDLKKEISQLRSERQKWVDLVSLLQAENKRLTGKEENS